MLTWSSTVHGKIIWSKNTRKHATHQKSSDFQKINRKMRKLEAKRLFREVLLSRKRICRRMDILQNVLDAWLFFVVLQGKAIRRLAEIDWKRK